MSKLSERQRLLRDLLDVMAVAILEEEDDEMLGYAGEDVDATGDGEDGSLFSEVEDAFDLLQLVESYRYLVPDRGLSSAHNSSLMYFTFRNLHPAYNDAKIITNESRCPHASVWLQLAVTLYRFAHYGTGASLKRSQCLWGIGKDTVDDYTDRVVLALGEMTSKYVRWPSEVERWKMARRTASTGFRGCVGFIDGTSKLFKGHLFTFGFPLMLVLPLTPLAAS
ncbi:hypothetical protein PHMEG_0002996 [Phytophthora megakarya]|uniref:Uncharacterized protein n=1 Tax=Phytophthora megakarya TaxID=4795 RepID=A0A225WX95_9STRA|nr:hypothetical protein PHMEG_0002996 [Phytophthora megakarya]